MATCEVVRASDVPLHDGSHQEVVRLLAYELWDRTGRPEGCALDHWLTAEAELAVRAEGGGPGPHWW